MHELLVKDDLLLVHCIVELLLCNCVALHLGPQLFVRLRQLLMLTPQLSVARGQVIFRNAMPQ